MALRAKVRGRWRIVSKAMARVFVRRGVEVVDTGDAPVAPVERIEATPAPRMVEVRAYEVTAVERTVVSSELVPVEFDLTDEELERLTAPEA